MSKPFYSLKNNCAAIEISGEEVGSFLNDILTAELNLLPVGKMQMSCLLSPQGRILHDMLIYRIRTNCFWIEINKNQILDLKNRLAIYKLRKKLKFRSLKIGILPMFFMKMESFFHWSILIKSSKI